MLGSKDIRELALNIYIYLYVYFLLVDCHKVYTRLYVKDFTIKSLATDCFNQSTTKTSEYSVYLCLFAFSNQYKFEK